MGAGAGFLTVERCIFCLTSDTTTCRHAMLVKSALDCGFYVNFRRSYFFFSLFPAPASGMVRF